MIPALLVGASAGVGLLLLIWALVPPRVDLAAAVGRFDMQRSRAIRVDPTAVRTMSDRIGLWVTAQLANFGWMTPRLRANLALLDRSMEAHMVTKLVTAMTGLLLPALVVTALAFSGVGVGFAIPTITALALAAAFSFLPDISVAKEAEERRNDLRRALALYLDLVSMALAGGRGVPEALPSAARIGQGWAFELLGDTINAARLSGVTPWKALTELGERVQVSELRDLGAALSLVSDDGAKIRDSLRSRAATARSRQLAEAEGQAEKSSESIKNAHLMLGFAFFVFLAFPALAAVMTI